MGVRVTDNHYTGTWFEVWAQASDRNKFFCL